MLWIQNLVTSWPHEIKILTTALQNAKDQLESFSQASPFHLNSRICLEYFVQNCLKKHWFIFNSTHTPWNLQCRQILVFSKSLLMLKLIFEATEFWQTTEFTIFPKKLSLAFVWSIILVRKATRIELGLYSLRFTFY